MEKFQYKLIKIKNDASFREFYRKYTNKKTSILVKAKKEKFKNLVAYSAINEFLRQNKILAPKLIKYSFYKGEIEIEDFGNISFLKYLKKSKNKYAAYKKIINLLLKLQKIEPKKTINFKKKYKIYLNYYDNKNLHKESDLFFDWYLSGLLGKKKAINYKILIKKELNKLYKRIYFKNSFFVHRDFHVSNFMIFKKKIGVLDSQDAIIGHPAYDLVSLIDDVRIKIPLLLQKKLFYLYIKKSSKSFKKKIDNFKNDFNILSVQRNLKILGIFYRLFKRDKKKQYLKFMANTWRLIEMRSRSEIFRKLNVLLNKAVNQKERKKKIFK